LLTQAAYTPSPNSGWPMAAMALALDVRLGKPGVYVLHPSGRVPGATDMYRAGIHARNALLALVLLALLALFFVAK
jgi:adenosylcobinamide-phosphate synthase